MSDRLNDEQVAECAAWEPWPFAPHEKKPTLQVLAREVQESRTRIAALEAAIDAYVATVDGLHKRSTEYDACMWDDEGWPCAERLALDTLKEARR